MAASADFVMGFMCCGLLGLLYLLYQLIQILRELLMVLKDELQDE